MPNDEPPKIAVWALVAVGVAMAIFSMVIFAVTENATSQIFAGIAVGSIIAGATLPRLIEAGFGPSGANLKLSPMRDHTADLAAAAGPIALDQVDEPHEMISAARNSLAGESLARVLTPATGERADFQMRLYLLDEDQARLVPVLLPTDEDNGPHTDTVWEVGKGATGRAFAEGDFVFVRGDAIWDSTYDVSPEQAELFKTLTAVASMPVFNAAGDTIAVITATTEASDLSVLATVEQAFDTLLGRSLLVARALVDLLGWFPDGYDARHGH
jgi:hypothetical protein